jgi:hypothetical protein
MTMRSGEAGTILFGGVLVAVVGTIASGADADVEITDPSLIGLQQVVATTSGAPAAGLGIVGAWVSDPVLGKVKVRFTAIGGTFTGPVNTNVFVQQLL